MSIRWTDVMKTVAPAAVAFIPGIGIPAAIALSAAMKGGISAAEGGSGMEILRDTALGAASGAGGAALGGAISKGLGTAASKAAEKGMDVGVKQVADATSQAIAKGGTEAVGTLTDAGLSKATEAATSGLARQALLQKGADLTAGARGKNPDKTASMLKTVQSGGKVVGAFDQAASMMAPETPRFSQQHMAMAQQHPGMNPNYQFGIHGASGNSGALGFGRFY